MKKLDYKTMTIDDIIAWCKENDEIPWLKELADKKVESYVYPRIKVDGKSVADKTKPPVKKMTKIPYVTIKTEFVKKFMPEIMPKSTKKPNMYDRIKNL